MRHNLSQNIDYHLQETLFGRGGYLSLTRWNCFMTELKKSAKYNHALFIMDCLCLNQNFPPPDKVSFNIAIDVLGRSKRFDHMQTMLLHMIQCGFQPDVRTFTSMICAYLNARQGVAVLQTLDMMRAHGVEPNDHTHKVLESWELSAVGRIDAVTY